MKKIKCLLISLIMLASSSLFAKDFDWSQCWCNYGAGIKPGTISIDFAIGINDDFLRPFDNSPQNWAIPYLDASFDIALPIWKLPLSWGGFFGANFGGGHGDYWEYSMFYAHFGGQVKYHVMLPVKNLDVYAGVRLGATLGRTVTKTYGEERSDTSGSGFHWSTFLGAHYYLNNTFGFVLEFGYPVWAKTGVSIKF